MTTEQESFWKGEFGSDYIERNCSSERIASNISFFSRVLEKTSNVSSIIELGSNIGMNLYAIEKLLPQCSLTAVEINEEAVKTLGKWEKVDVIHQSILDLKIEKKFDFSFTKGVLIHINPDMLGQAYKALYESSTRYIMVAEYYDPNPVSIEYRGHRDRLFKRDFAGDMLDMYPDLHLVDYGFVYHRDNTFKQDDITWFLLEK